MGYKAQLSAIQTERDNALELLEKAKGETANKPEDLDTSENLEAGLKIAELHKSLAEKDKYILRLSEQAKAQIQEYKEVAKALFGYSLSKHKDSNNKAAAGQYQVKSLFAASSKDVLLFSASEGGKQVSTTVQPVSTGLGLSTTGFAGLCFPFTDSSPPLSKCQAYKPRPRNE